MYSSMLGLLEQEALSTLVAEQHSKERDLKSQEMQSVNNQFLNMFSIKLAFSGLTKPQKRLQWRQLKNKTIVGERLNILT